ncbi:MAG TPA: SprB repeat-containing protein [Bacteroidales bacterium]|nr:SprB repeat-containing protein [Bacteroidales bacterium]HNS45706.1 SprB repeat-containing protein [Bacteroidales bacterium]
MKKYFTLLHFIGLFTGLCTSTGINAQTTTIPAGSFIINMGVTPQTVYNGTKPYGLVYQLLSLKCPVHWVINPAKTDKEATDFTYNGVDFKSGAFIVEAQYRTASVDALISTWTNPSGSYKVVGVTTTSPLTLNFPIFKTLYSIPRWTMDKQNGSIAVNFFNYASIPPVAYGGSSSSGWDLPAALDCCDDLFVMPHADPTWATHRNLYDWNESCKGAIWLGCHAGSALEDMFDNIIIDGDPIDPTQQTNFLSEENGPAVGSGPYSDPGNALILWGDHSAGTLPYTFNNTYATDPVAQFQGSIDAATQNGSEQIYIPAFPGAQSSGWRPTTKVLVYDPNHPQAYQYPNTPLTHVGAILAYGPGLGESDRANVMLEASHNISGTGPANVAAMRAFFNFSFLSSTIKIAIPEIQPLPNPLYSGTPYECTFTWYGNQTPISIPITIQWTSSCGGTFTPNSTSQTVNFTPPTAPNPISCQISVTVTDACGRVTFDTHSQLIQCDLSVSSAITNPCYGVPNGGAISMTANGGETISSYSWTKSGGGSGSGSGSVISNLSAGTYTVTATATNGCIATFTVTLTESPQIIINATPVNVSCNGGATGGINTMVSGGIPGYTFAWISPPTGFSSTNQNLSGLTAGTYNLTVTDSKGCTAATSAEVTQPAAIVITPTITNVTCYGENNGIINLSVSGGTSPYTFLWNDGNSSQNRTGLAPGTYSVTVTDANSCTQTYESILVSEPATALILGETHVNVLCYGASTGSIDLTVSGGTGPYTHSWTKTGTPAYGASTEDLNGLAAGTYNVTVTDNKLCTATLSIEITQPPALVLNLTITHPTCPPSADPPVNADGTIDLTVTGGTAPYTIDWSDLPGASDPEDRTGLQAGAYSVTVTDASGCSITTSESLNYMNPNPIPPTGINH